jgi:ZIP family zinc transporter
MEMLHSLQWAALGTLFTFAMTTLGAGLVFLLPGGKTSCGGRGLLGFAAGVMTASAVWSLLLPAIDRAEALGLPGWLPPAGGMLAGAAFLSVLEALLSPFRAEEDGALLMTAITLHNIPEGMAVGLAFALAAEGEGFGAAAALALGVGLQNFPEGAAVSLPLKREGFSGKKSFIYGQASGMVEPMAGVLGALLVVYIEAILPYALSFAAGAMILVAVHELIPECQKDQEDQPYFATMGIILGFATMMLLDVALG